MKWCRKAADQNNATAQFYLGSCYFTGKGVPKDEAEAVKWTTLAASQNLALAKTFLPGIQKKVSKKNFTEGKKRAEEWLQQWNQSAARGEAKK